MEGLFLGPRGAGRGRGQGEVRLGRGKMEKGRTSLIEMGEQSSVSGKSEAKESDVWGGEKKQAGGGEQTFMAR